MVIPNTLRLNGKVMTRTSCAVRVNGIIRITGIDTLDWNDERPQPLVPGMNNGGPPIGKADGAYNCGANLSLYLDECAKFEAAILALNPLAIASGDLTMAQFQLVIAFTEELRSRGVLLANCTIAGRPTRTVSNDGSAIVAQYALQPTYIVEDGRSLVSLIPSVI